MSTSSASPVQSEPSHDSSVPFSELLRDRHLQINNLSHWHQEMASAEQLLNIGTDIVCHDHLLIQHVRYTSPEQLQREVTTLGIKKDIFSPFDKSITLMPKYCYTIPATCSTLLIHSVPPFTLESLLSRCEQEYPFIHLENPVYFYRTWCKTIQSRYHDEIVNDKGTFLKVVGSLRKLIYPSPARIPLRQRKRFAALIVNMVCTHHNNGIYNDDITPRTIFLRAVNQPVVLANYTGMPSPILADTFPSDFKRMEQHLMTHGQQMRDVFSLAQITFRILSGHPSSPDGAFSDTPQPVRSVMRHLIEQSALAEKHALSDYHHYLKAFSFIIRNLLSRSLRVFSLEYYPHWRRFNRATGGFWRTVPLIGAFADIFFPTRCAAVLRSLLDNHWFYHTFIRIPSFRYKPRKVHLELLLSALKTGISVGRSEYGKVFSYLQGDAARKRYTFDFIMEQSTSHTPEKHTSSLKVLLLIPAMLIIVIPFFFIGNLRRSTIQTKQIITDSTAQRENRADSPRSETPVVKKELVRPIRKSDPPAPDRGQPAGNARKEVRSRPLKPVRKKHSTTVTPEKHTPTPKKKILSPTPVQTGVPVVAQSEATESTLTRAPAYCHLVPASNNVWNVFYVEGDCIMCSLHQLRYTDEKNGEMITLGQRSDPADKYYIVKKGDKGYGKIETVRRCKAPPCEKGMYYKAGRGKGTGPEAVVTPGDLVGFNYFTLNAFLIRSKKRRR